MPGEDGYELVRRVRELPAERGGQTPAAALTAFARVEDRRRALRAGLPDATFAKPVDIQWSWRRWWPAWRAGSGPPIRLRRQGEVGGGHPRPPSGSTVVTTSTLPQARKTSG